MEGEKREGGFQDNWLCKQCKEDVRLLVLFFFSFPSSSSLRASNKNRFYILSFHKSGLRRMTTCTTTIFRIHRIRLLFT